LTGILCCDSGDKRPRHSLDHIAEPDNAVLLSGYEYPEPRDNLGPRPERFSDWDNLADRPRPPRNTAKTGPDR